MSKEVVFSTGINKIKVPLNRIQLNEFSSEVADQLYQKNEYEIQTKVEISVFQSFILHYTKQKAITENDLLNIDKIYQYYLLIKELGINTDLLSKPEYENILKLAVIKNVANDVLFNKSFLEEYIIENLDFYLDNFPKEMHQVPIQILYNIFNKQKQVDHAKLYHFIMTQNDSQPENIYPLLSLLDCLKLPKEITKECIIKQEEHFGFIPKNCSHFTENISNENLQLKETISSQNQIIFKLAGEMNCHTYHQFHMTKENGEGILNFVRNNSDKFDPGFIASVSSNDIYNLLVNKGDKNDDGFYFYCNSNEKNYPRNSSLSFELEKETKVTYIQIYGSKASPVSLSYEINDTIQGDISVEQAKILRDNDPTKRILTIKLEQPVNLYKLTITAKDPTTTKITWPFLSGLELFSSDLNSKGVFQTLIENSKFRDPHRCVVYAYSTLYCTNYFHSLQKKGLMRHLITFDKKDSWLKVELTKGVALIDGIRLQMCGWAKLVDYKIIASDNLSKEEKDWPVLHAGEKRKDEKEKDENIDFMQFNKYIKIKAIKIIQTGKNIDTNKIDNNHHLKLYHFDISGLYFPF